MLVSLDGVTKYFADKLILDGISASVNEDDRIGLVGVNGAGKTTLINVILSGVCDGGTVSKAGDLSIGVLRQDSGLESGNSIENEMYGVFADVLACGRRMEKISEDLAKTPHDSAEFLRLSRELERETSYFEAHDGYRIDVSINKILNGMGFSEFDRSTVIDTMSGGEKTRLALAKLLLEKPRLLILDEPTNHLDFATLAWLEDYLQGYKGAILTVSHDRYFLDKIVSRVWEIEDRKIMTFRGNYTSYKRQKAEYVERRQKEYEKQQTQINSMLDYAQRNIARASTSNSAKSRLHRLANMEIIEAPRTHRKTPQIKFEYDAPPVKDVLSVKDMALKAGDKLLVNGLEFEIKRGEKVAVIGKNGCGKSTLLKSLIFAHEERVPHISWGKNTTLAYYEQEGRDLDPENTLLGEMLKRYPRIDKTYARSLLGRVLLSGEEVFKQIKVLSGGERARLCFALIMARRANVLCLDEPTNHVDLEGREALESALREFDGTLVLVSHDRYLINAVATRVLAFENGEVKSYEGNFDDYVLQKAAQTAPVKETAAQNENAAVYYRSKKQRSEEAARKNKIAELERQMQTLSNRMAEIEGLLASPEVGADYERAQELCEELENIKIRHEECETLWLSLSE